MNKGVKRAFVPWGGLRMHNRAPPWLWIPATVYGHDTGKKQMVQQKWKK
jgi:hypothetical protein